MTPVITPTKKQIAKARAACGCHLTIAGQNIATHNVHANPIRQNATHAGIQAGAVHIITNQYARKRSSSGKRNANSINISKNIIKRFPHIISSGETGCWLIVRLCITGE